MVFPVVPMLLFNTCFHRRRRDNDEDAYHHHHPNIIKSSITDKVSVSRSTTSRSTITWTWERNRDHPPSQAAAGVQEEQEEESSMPLIPFLEIHQAAETNSPKTNNTKEENEDCGLEENAKNMTIHNESFEEFDDNDEDDCCLEPVPTEVFVHKQQQQEVVLVQQRENWIFDVAAVLVQGRLPLEADDALQLAANRFERLLKRHMQQEESSLSLSSSFTQEGSSSSAAVTEACKIIRQYPEVAEIEYYLADFLPPSKLSALQDHKTYHRRLRCCPIFYFCATGNLQGVKATYQAYPEAVGHIHRWLGTPLHYACSFRSNPDVVQFLLKRFPRAARSTNEDRYQTALHLACRNACSSSVIELLLESFPAAAQLADAQGDTPLHSACRQPACSRQVLQLLLSNKSGGGGDTRSLHLAAQHQHGVAVRALVSQLDPTLVSATMELQQTALHKAVQAPTVSVEVVRELVRAYPAARECRDELDERPIDLAKRLGGASPAVLELLKTDELY